MSDAEHDLIQRAVSGDRQSFGMLYERYLEQIYRFIYFRVSHQQEAEDLTEEVFMRVWQSLPRMKKDAEIQNFRSWVYRITRNLVIDYYRKRGAQSRGADTGIDKDALLQEDLPLPEEAVQSGEESQQLLAAVNRLDALQREVLLHRFVNGYSHAQTASLMGLRENNIRVLQYRALKKVKAWLDAGGKK